MTGRGTMGGAIMPSSEGVLVCLDSVILVSGVKLMDSDIILLLLVVGWAMGAVTVGGKLLVGVTVGVVTGWL